MKTENSRIESISFEKELQLLLKLSLAITTAKDLKEALKITLKEICLTIGWEAADAWWVNFEDEHLEFLVSYCSQKGKLKEFCEEGKKFRFKKENSLPGRAWATKNTFWVEDIYTADVLLRKEAALKVGIRSGLAVPVPLGGEVLAILSFYSISRKNEDKALNRLLNALAGQLGLYVNQKLSEAKLISSEMRFRSIVETSPEAIIISDSEGKIIVSNVKAEQMFGYNADELTLKSIHFLRPERYREAYKKKVKHYLDTGDIESLTKPLELLGLRKDGSEFPVELSIGAWKTHEGVFFTEIIRDISIRKDAEQLKERFQNIFNNSDDSILTKTLDGIVTSWNPASEKIYGYSAREMIGKSMKLLIPEEYQKEHREILLKISNGEHVSHHITKRIRKDGKVIYVSLTISPLINNENKIIGAATIGRDITNELELQKEREELNTFVRKIADLIPNVVTVTDLKTNKNIWFNRELTEAFGYTREDIQKDDLSKLTMSIVHPDDMELVKERQERIKQLRGDETYTIELRIKHKNGEWRWVRSKTAIFEADEDGIPVKSISIVEDITTYKVFEKHLAQVNIELERKVKERTKELEEKNELLKKTIEEEQKYKEIIKEKEETLTLATHSTEIGTWDYYPETGQMIWSDIAKELFRLPVNEDVSFEKKLNRIHPEDRERVKEAAMNALRPGSDGNYDVEFRLVPEEDKPLRWLNSRGKVFFNQEGKPERFVGIAHNITSVKEQAKRQDEFIGIASHELKTPITSMKGYLQIMETMLDKQKDNKVLNFLNKAEQNLDKLLHLVNDLLDVTKIQAGKLPLHVTEFNLNDLIDETISHFQHTTKQHKLIKEGTLTKLIEADKHRIEQVLVNYLTNAIKYSPEADKVVVTVSEENGFAKVAVKDFGIGIPKHRVKHVFEKYYRVEEASKKFSGLGLGLNIASEIITRHGGKVWAESESGKGSTFYFTLPVKN